MDTTLRSLQLSSVAVKREGWAQGNWIYISQVMEEMMPLPSGGVNMSAMEEGGAPASNTSSTDGEGRRRRRFRALPPGRALRALLSCN